MWEVHISRAMRGYFLGIEKIVECLSLLWDIVWVIARVLSYIKFVFFSAIFWHS